MTPPPAARAPPQASPRGEEDRALWRALLAEQEELGGAVLDINLNDDWCFPIARMLCQRDVPFIFIFLTGHDDTAIIPVELRTVRRLGKPILGQQLVEVLTEVI